MNDIIFVDPLSERGHQNFNCNFISFFKGKSRSIYCASNHEISNIEQKEVFDSALLSKKNRTLYKLRQLIILIKSISVVRKSPAPYVIFLSYELFSFALFSHFLCILLSKKKIYVIEHNTFVPNHYFKACFFRCISSKIRHICLSEYIEEEISAKGKRTIFITHPFGMSKSTLSRPQTSSIELKKEHLGFMPSSNIETDIIANVKELISKSKTKCLLFYKGKDDSVDGDFISKKHFENYEQLLSLSNLVFIPQKFEYRVSGVFFEAITSENSIIVMSDCVFSRAMISIFGDSIVILDDLLKLDDGLSWVLENNALYSDRRILIEQLEEKSMNNLRREFYDEF